MVGAATSIIFVMTKVLSRQTCVCHGKTHLLSQQKYAYKSQQQNFGRNKYLSRQTRVSRDKTFVTTSILFWRDKRHALSRQTCVWCDKSILAMIKLLLQPNYVCHDKYFSPQHFCCDKNILSRQDKHTFVATNMCCRDKKIILVAAPTNDREIPQLSWQRREMRNYYDGHNQSSGRFRKILWLL